ncbi:DUF4294 domain-containing protein [Dysgonomonas sp. HDW5A]|uniref:DUF4294 domain-containing protein n=1 Tax=Dysgonomonas sp. HDW5A TaxID=2714926 RepID=UPI00140ABE5D|nr:DUF4294 domain-containing protein [Dysgonomonas sp. HDW5A]QIK58491.1 DUF4294 domain-containing protein [Dysgonomonas sp. HDW5A]
MQKYICILFLSVLCISYTQAQSSKVIQYTFSVVKGDTIFNAYLPETVVFPPLRFKDEKERLEYTKLVRDVKITLPYAKQVAQNIIETYEFMETLPDKKAKQKHLEQTQKFIMDSYKPKMKKLTKNQGKILVKLIDRQTNSSAYDIIKSLTGGIKATVYNTFAGIFGNNLKTQYDPNGKDKMIERIVIEIEQGTL